MDGETALLIFQFMWNHREIKMDRGRAMGWESRRLGGQDCKIAKDLL